jgi:molecular chaperone DnaK (HSP70)
MTEKGAKKPGPEPGDRVAIGVTFGNSTSSIAYTVDDRAEVIANEDGGMWPRTRDRETFCRD